MSDASRLHERYVNEPRFHAVVARLRHVIRDAQKHSDLLVDSYFSNDELLAYAEAIDVLYQPRAEPRPEAIQVQGRVYLPLAMAEEATGCRIEVGLLATHLNGIHLPPGERYNDRFAPIPAVARFTGAEPQQQLPEPLPDVIAAAVRGGLPFTFEDIDYEPVRR